MNDDQLKQMKKSWESLCEVLQEIFKKAAENIQEIFNYTYQKQEETKFWIPPVRPIRMEVKPLKHQVLDKRMAIRAITVRNGVPN